MKYVVYRRFKNKAICGQVNLPALTQCEMENGLITFHGEPICVVTSENAHNYFARNDDGLGIERGNLTQKIIRRLSKKDDQYQDRWDMIWDDAICQKYRRHEHEDHWIWGHAFYNAGIEDLQHIASLIGA